MVDSVESVWPGSQEEVSAFARRILVMASYGGYDVEPTAERFLMLERNVSPVEAPYRLPVIVLNWWDDLRALGHHRP